MKVSCSSCGGELLGSVNRCWRCGTPIVSRPGPIDQPPVRQVPLDAGDGELIVAEFAEDGDQASEQITAGDAPAQPSDEGHSPQQSEPSTAEQQRASSSPDVVITAEASSETSVATGEVASPADYLSAPRPTYYPKHTAAKGGAVGALLLALMSLGGAYYTIGTVFTSLLGIGLGAWGIYSNYRGLAIFAMVLCCLALLIACAFGAINLYTDIHGYGPFETPPPEFDDGF